MPTTVLWLNRKLAAIPSETANPGQGAKISPVSSDARLLPVDYDANVNIGEIPYTPPVIGGGQAPTLDAADIANLIAFLCTLTDGYDPSNPSAYNVPAQCTAPVTVIPTTSATARGSGA